MIQFTILL